MKNFKILAIGLCLAAGITWAHGGVQNPKVMDRMNNMTDIADEVKTLAKMSKGAIPFDAEAARGSANKIAAHAEETITLFTNPESDPKSEAKPNIWTEFEDFTAKSNELRDLALRLSSSISEVSDLELAVSELGKNCKSCHSVYRQ